LDTLPLAECDFLLDFGKGFYTLVKAATLGWGVGGYQPS
jgi:hypothetical protein